MTDALELRLGGHTSTEFSGGFVIDEQKLVRIDDIIRSRVNLINNNIEIIYKVYREDNFVANYDIVGNITKGDNSPSKKVGKLRVIIENEHIKLELQFSKSEKSFLKIESSDRDAAFLLTSDLKEYLNQEVFSKNLLFKRDISDTLFLLFPVGVLISMMYFAFRHNNSEQIRLALKSENIVVKLDALLQQQEASFSEKSDVRYLFIAMIAIMVITLSRSALIKYFSLKIFYWGSEIQRYDRQRLIADRVFWVIIVGFGVGIAAAYLAPKSLFQ